MYKETYKESLYSKKGGVHTRKATWYKETILKRSVDTTARRSSVHTHDKPCPVIRFSYDTLFALDWHPDYLSRFESKRFSNMLFAMQSFIICIQT